MKQHPDYISSEELEADIRYVIMATAGILGALYHFPKQMRDEFLGVDIPEEDWQPGFYTDWPDDHLWQDMPIEHHPLTQILRVARAYAFQEGEWPDEHRLKDIWDEIAPIADHLPRTDINGLPTPARRSLGSFSPLPNDPPEMRREVGRLRRVIDMFEARWDLDRGNWLTIAQIAILSGLGEETVRTTINKEGLRTAPRESGGRGRADEGKAAEINGLSNAEARDFLSRRRGFIPSRSTGVEPPAAVAERILFEGSGLFPDRLKRLLAARGLTPAELAEAAGTPPDWTDAIVAGATTEARIEDLVRLARALDCAPGRFAAIAVEHLLT